MANVYIFTLNNKGELTKVVWDDVITQRSTGKITTKRSREYKLSHGEYIYKSHLNKITGNIYLTRGNCAIERAHYDVPIGVDGCLIYCSYEDELPNSIRNQMYAMYYGQIAEIQRIYLNNLVQLIKDVNFQFLHPVDYSAFFENPFETFKDAILTKIKETMVEGN